MREVRRAADQIWRPRGWERLASVFLGVAVLAGTTWLARTGPLSLRDGIVLGCADVAVVLLSPVVLFRWRMVLDSDAVYLVFVRVRRLEVRSIVEAKVLPRDGLTFVMDDGRTESIGLVGNSAWAHRRTIPTRADLAARAVLVAAAAARGDDPPVDYRLPPMKGLRKSMVEDGIVAVIVGLLLGNL